MASLADMIFSPQNPQQPGMQLPVNSMQPYTNDIAGLGNFNDLISSLTAQQNPQVQQQAPQDDLAVGGNPATLSSRIQEWLGAKDPNQGGQVSDILSGRFQQQPSFNDIGNSAIQTLQSGSYVPAQQYADQRLQDSITRLDQISKLQKGSELPSDIQTAQYLQAHPELQPLFFASKRAQKVIDLGGQQMGLDAYGNPINTYNKTLPPQDTPAVKGAQTGAQESARLGYAQPIAEATGRGQNKTEIDKQQLTSVNAQALSNQGISNLIVQARGLIQGGVLGNTPSDRAAMFGHDLGINNSPESVRTTALRNLGNQFVLARGSLGTGVSTADAARYDSAAGNFSRAQSIQQMTENLDIMQSIADKYMSQGNTYNQQYNTTGQVPAYGSQNPTAPIPAQNAAQGGTGNVVDYREYFK